jgi:glutathione S-transferase
MHAPRLITFAHSHYCEKARWALDLAGVPYREERWLPLLHLWRTRRLGGRSVPILVAGDRVLRESADIVAWAAAAGDALRPASAEERSSAAETERWLDRELGPHARRWAYAELLGCKALLNRCVASGLGPGQRPLTPAVMSLARPLIRRAFRITPDSAARSLARVHEVFATVGERLADGDGWLVGRAFTSADLAFAALAAPVLLPEGFGGALPRLDEVPATMRAEVTRLRDSTAGRHALLCYERHRAARPARTGSPRA